MTSLLAWYRGVPFLSTVAGEGSRYHYDGPVTR